jgi:hypothetical protein
MRDVFRGWFEQDFNNGLGWMHSWKPHFLSPFTLPQCCECTIEKKINCFNDYQAQFEVRGPELLHSVRVRLSNRGNVRTTGLCNSGKVGTTRLSNCGKIEGISDLVTGNVGNTRLSSCGKVATTPLSYRDKIGTTGLSNNGNIETTSHRCKLWIIRLSTHGKIEAIRLCNSGKVETARICNR